KCLDLTVDYTKDRVQFGRPIGSFQALKHRMADLYVAVQSARAVVNDAIAEPSQTSAALARVAASEAFSKVAAEAVQMHGGIAITWEHDIQLYFKRAHGSAQLLGPPREHLRRLESEVFSRCSDECFAARRDSTVLCDGRVAGRRRTPAHTRRSGEPVRGPAERGCTGSSPRGGERGV